MATTTTTATTASPPPQEMASPNVPPPSYFPSQPRGDQEITAAAATTTTTTTTTAETPATIDEKRALQQPQPALIQPMQADGTPQPQPANPLDNPVPVESLLQLPGPIDCPNCHKRVMTRTDLESGNTVTAWAIGICCVLGVCCAWIPCVMDSCKDTIHYCSECQSRVVTITNSGTVKLHPRITPAPTPKQRAG